ncbi:MAG: hypothetical protein ACOCUV_02640 [bacterium]
MKNKTRKSQKKIFKDLYTRYNGSPMAVSSESMEHKRLRFKFVTDIFKCEDNISVHDVGMGIADMYQFIKDEYPDKSIEYSGTEILKEFVDESKRRYPDLTFYYRDIAEKSYEDIYDYILMSGLFHQRRDSSIRDWEDFACNIIFNSFKMCKKGIAFNFISPFVDYYQTQVYYCNFPKYVNFINDKLSRFFEIRHCYPLFEFTVYVYQKDFIRKHYLQQEFQKYF